MDTRDTITQLDRWFELGGFATAEARALALRLRVLISEPDPDEALDVFPTELQAEVIELMFNGSTPKIREAAVELLQAVNRDGFLPKSD